MLKFRFQHIRKKIGTSCTNHLKGGVAVQNYLVAKVDITEIAGADASVK